MISASKKVVMTGLACVARVSTEQGTAVTHRSEAADAQVPAERRVIQVNRLDLDLDAVRRVLPALEAGEAATGVKVQGSAEARGGGGRFTAAAFHAWRQFARRRGHHECRAVMPYAGKEKSERERKERRKERERHSLRVSSHRKKRWATKVGRRSCLRSARSLRNANQQ